MKPLTASQLLTVLKTHGFVLSRQKGSHMIWKNPRTGIIVPVPTHGKSKPINIGTFLAIIKQSKIPKEEFKSL